MTNPADIARRLVGNIDWQPSGVFGFCNCPGESDHTKPNRKKDCRVSIDGAPTIYCLHTSCAPKVAAANLQLRRELGASPWELTLPGGQVLRSGGVLQASGEVKPREAIQAEARAAGRSTDEHLVLESVRVMAERFKPELFEKFRWPFDQIIAESPLRVSERDAADQFRIWLTIWPGQSHVWIGDVENSGRPEHKTHFRPIADWLNTGPVMGNYTCGSSFKPGSFSRCNENVNDRRFLVVESDTLSKDEVGSVFAFLRGFLRYRLHAIIDTGGKSLHGWFDAPPNKVFEERLKAALVVFGCDPKLFTPSQPVRVPGAPRDGKLQRLVWMRNDV